MMALNGFSKAAREMVRKITCRRIHSSHSGFTLIELMVTLVLVGILAVLVAPGLHDRFVRERLVSSLNGMIGLLQLARNEAVSRNQESTVCPTEDGNTCANAFSGDGRLLLIVSADGRQEVLRELQISRGIDVSSSVKNRISIRFTPRGSPADKPSSVWELTSSQGRCVRLGVNLAGQPDVTDC